MLPTWRSASISRAAVRAPSAIDSLIADASPVRECHTTKSLGEEESHLGQRGPDFAPSQQQRRHPLITPAPAAVEASLKVLGKLKFVRVPGSSHVQGRGRRLLLHVAPFSSGDEGRCRGVRLFLADRRRPRPRAGVVDVIYSLLYITYWVTRTWSRLLEAIVGP
jgi:hypothetical protein